MTTVGKIWDEQQNKFDYCEVYRFTGKGIPHVHSHCIDEIVATDDLDWDEICKFPVDDNDYWIMDEEMYDHTVCADSYFKFNHKFDIDTTIPNAKILVILVSGTTFYYPNIDADRDLFELGSYDETTARIWCEAYAKQHPESDVYLCGMDMVFGSWDNDSELIHKAE